MHTGKKLNSDINQRRLYDATDVSLFTLYQHINEKGDLKLGENIRNSLMEIKPQGNIIKTIPKYVPKEKKKSHCITMKPKEPKFVPYEPFKAAVEPIIPRKTKILITSELITRNNIDIQELVTQMSEIRTDELKKAELNMQTDENKITFKQWEKQKLAYETDIGNLKESNSHLENQLKFQAQVNRELKTLLVAAVGEDLESRVQHLTEDKLQLARALLNSAQHLTSHQERTEWLSGQCEVWRSKFLASSLMIEELARWKSALTNRINELHEVMKLLIEERSQVRQCSLKTHSKLYILQQQLSRLNEEERTGAIGHLKSSNIIDVSRSNLELSNIMCTELVKDKGELQGKTSQDEESTSKSINRKLSTNTFAENLAARILKNPVTVSTKPDPICTALMGVAAGCLNTSDVRKYSIPGNHCCAHCKGEWFDI